VYTAVVQTEDRVFPVVVGVASVLPDQHEVWLERPDDTHSMWLTREVSK